MRKLHVSNITYQNVNSYYLETDHLVTLFALTETLQLFLYFIIQMLCKIDNKKIRLKHIYVLRLKQNSNRLMNDCNLFLVQRELTYKCKLVLTLKEITYLGPPDIVVHVSSVQYSHMVPYNRLILLKKSTTVK